MSVRRDYRALQRMAEPGTEAMLGRAVIMQVLMERRGHDMLDRSSNSVRRESRA
jgi:hypothetical protein